MSGVTAAKYVALGTVFEDVAGGDIAVKDVLTVGTPVGSGAMGGADQIWRWNTASSSWTKYFYYSGRGITQWRKNGETKETSDTIPAGETFFFLRAPGSAETTLTLAGAVKDMSSNSSFTVAPAQLAFAANPWPASMAIKDFANYYTSGSVAGSGAMGGADQIWRWNTDTSSWTKYFYYSGRGTTQWRKNGETTETADSINAGEGFFFQRAPGSTTATVTLTYK